MNVTITLEGMALIVLSMLWMRRLRRVYPRVHKAVVKLTITGALVGAQVSATWHGDALGSPHLTVDLLRGALVGAGLGCFFPGPLLVMIYHLVKGDDD